MNKRVWIIFIAGLFSTAPAWSQPAGMAPYPGGPGMGPGMMGGVPGKMGCDGPGAMGYGPDRWAYNIPDLTEEQRNKIMNIQKEFRQKQWTLMEKMHEQNVQQGNFYRNGKLDEQAARKAYEMTGSLQKQMFENYLEAQKRTDSTLTAEQLRKLHGTGIQ